MVKEMKADFCIEITFQRGSENPSRVFRAMTELIETFQEMDRAFVESIDATIEPIVVIEDIEAGSIKTWLGYVLKSIDDDALKNLNWKQALGKYLVNAKYLVINFIEGKTEITDRREIEELEQKLLSEAKETDITHIPSYTLIQRQKLLVGIDRLSKALDYLNDTDAARYITKDQAIKMNTRFKIVPEKIEELLTQETIESTSEMILKVKKPDYLGDSMWEFRHGTRAIVAKILDIEWLTNFQNRKYDVRPGDSLRVHVKTSVQYGYDNEVVNIRYSILKVIAIIPLSTSNQLPLLPDTEQQGS